MYAVKPSKYRISKSILGFALTPLPIPVTYLYPIQNTIQPMINNTTVPIQNVIIPSPL